MAQDEIEREYIGTVVLLTGKEVRIYMPTIGDTTNMSLTTLDAMHRLCAVACRMSIDEFRTLSLPDGNAIADKLANAFTILSPVWIQPKKGK